MRCSRADAKFDAHDPTLPLIPEARSIRAPHQDEPRIGRSRRGDWGHRRIMRAASNDATMLDAERKASLVRTAARLW
jgi:hypothetical protein